MEIENNILPNGTNTKTKKTLFTQQHITTLKEYFKKGMCSKSKNPRLDSTKLITKCANELNLDEETVRVRLFFFHIYIYINKDARRYLTRRKHYC